MGTNNIEDPLRKSTLIGKGLVACIAIALHVGVVPVFASVRHPQLARLRVFDPGTNPVQAGEVLVADERAVPILLVGNRL